MNLIRVETELHELKPLSDKSLEFLECVLAPHFPPGARACADEALNRRLPEGERKPVILRCSFDQDDTDAVIRLLAQPGNVIESELAEARKNRASGRIDELSALFVAFLEMTMAVMIPAKGEAFCFKVLLDAAPKVNIDVRPFVGALAGRSTAN